MSEGCCRSLGQNGNGVPPGGNDSERKEINIPLWETFQRKAGGSETEKSEAIEIYFTQIDELPDKALEVIKQLADKMQPKEVRRVIAKRLKEDHNMNWSTWHELFDILENDPDPEVKEMLAEDITRQKEMREKLLGVTLNTRLPRLPDSAALALGRLGSSLSGFGDIFGRYQSCPKIMPQIDIEHIIGAKEAIVLYELMPIGKFEILSSFVSRSSGKTLTGVLNPQPSSLQRKFEKIALASSVIRSASRAILYVLHRLGQYIELILVCELHGEHSGRLECSMTEIQREIESQIPEELRGFFFENSEGKIVKRNTILPSLYIYNASKYEVHLKEDEVGLTRIYPATIRARADEFLREFEIDEQGGKTNLLNRVGINPKILTAAIGETLIVSRGDDSFEYNFGRVLNNFIALNFLPLRTSGNGFDENLVQFIVQLGLWLHVDAITKTIGNDIEKLSVPNSISGDSTDKEYLVSMKNLGRALNENLNSLDEVKQQYYLAVIEGLDENTQLFANEKTWIAWAKDGYDARSISDLFYERIIENKRRIDSLITNKRERIKIFVDSINSELILKGNKPVVNTFLKDIEGELVEQIAKWQGKIDQKEIEGWLLNFETKEERLLAIKILGKLSYIKDNEIELLCKSLLNKLKAELGTHDFGQCLFSHIGGPTSGSVHIIKPFQETNGLRNNLFVTSDKLAVMNKSVLILLDDFIGSGNTFVKWFKENKETLQRFERIYYCVAAAFRKGIDKIESETSSVKVIYGHMYESHSMAVQGELFSREDGQKIRELVLKYKKRLPPNLLWGYDDCELLVAFENNIPNNSLSILWASGTWMPLIDRR